MATKGKPLSARARAAMEARRVELERARGTNPHTPLNEITATLLPADVRDALVAAAGVADPQQRLLVVHQAVERAKDRYPNLFKKDHGNG